MKTDIPFWWKLLFSNSPDNSLNLLPKEWHNYYHNTHNLIKIFFDGFFSNFILGLILILLLFVFLILIGLAFTCYLLGIIFLVIFVPIGISIKTVSSFNLKKIWLSIVFIIIFTLTIWTIGYFFYVKLEEIYNPVNHTYSLTLNEILGLISFFTGIISLLFPEYRDFISVFLKSEAKNN